MKPIELLEAAGNNLLPAIAYGDATGLPFEATLAETVPPITAMPPIERNAYLAIPDELKGTRGIWSDDTHLSLASTISLLACDGFDLRDQADMTVAAYDHVLGATDDELLIPPIVAEKRNGYGGSTRKSIARLKTGIPPEESGAPDGAGNGVLMKLAPLTYWQYVNEVGGGEAFEQTVAYTRMTHGAGEAVVSSLVHSVLMTQLLSLDPYHEDAAQHRTAIYRDAIYLAEIYEKDYDAAATTSTFLRRIADPILHQQPTALSKDVLLAQISGEKGGGFHAPETLMMAYGSFMIEPEFPACVYRAAELGGDSDSIASIVGSMAAAYWGEIDFPHDVEELFAIDRLRHVSQQLGALANRKGV